MGLNSQTTVVIKQLTLRNGLTHEQATNLWYTSKTKLYLESNNLTYVSGMRCYWELMLEINKDSRWLNEPFDM